MAPRHYHAPIPKISTRPRCPVCGASVYSPAGIHPQCAVRQADPPRPRVKPLKATDQAAPPMGARESAFGDVDGDLAPEASPSATK